MTGYYLIFGLILALGGLAMIACPRRVWLLTNGWRFADPGSIRLSDAHVAWTRLSGAVGVVLGVVVVVYAFR
jgi:NhaP-type Na+/H+ and K+/H+ antiporter